MTSGSDSTACLSATAGVSETGNTIVDFTNPTPSIQAQAAYQAAGVPTAGVISATAGNVWAIASGSKPMTIFGNGIVGEDLQAGAGETNFVGGAGTQHLYGGQGVNIVTELAMSDRGDAMAGFIRPKDVIEILSLINANMTTAGVQNFTFIGTAAFTGAGAQVRYQFDTTKNVTTVQVALAGDTSADLRPSRSWYCFRSPPPVLRSPRLSPRPIWRPGGSKPTARSTLLACLYKICIRTSQGRTSTSYESSPLGPGHGILAADELNLVPPGGRAASGTTTPNQTVSKGSLAVELLQTGTGQDMLSSPTR